MGKKALVITKQHLPLELTSFDGCSVFPIPSGFFNLPVRMADRDTCETDETTLQLIPYIVLRKPDSKWGDTFFVYARGKAGEEARLHGSLSIGLGGHVDHVPNESETLLALLQREGAREFMEEANGTLDEPLKFVGLIVDNTNPVGRVHLGLLCFVNIIKDQELKLEADVIENGQWLETSDLLSPDLLSPDGVDRLENWTRAVVNHVELQPQAAS